MQIPPMFQHTLFLCNVCVHTLQTVCVCVMKKSGPAMAGPAGMAPTPISLEVIVSLKHR